MKAVYFFVFVFLSYKLPAQSVIIDSLQRVLKSEKEDTNKVNTLNQLSLRFQLQYTATDDKIALKLAKQSDMTPAIKLNSLVF